MNSATLYHTDGTEEQVSPANGKQFTVEEWQTLLGGYAAPHYLYGGEAMLVDEDGFPKDLPRNQSASIISGTLVVGPALVGSRKLLGV